MPYRCPLAVLAALGLVAVTATANMAQAETKATPAATGSAHPAAATIGAFMPAGYREAGRRTASSMVKLRNSSATSAPTDAMPPSAASTSAPSSPTTAASRVLPGSIWT